MHKDEIAAATATATATSPPRQLRSAASNGSFSSAGGGGTLKLKSGRPRAPVPVSVLTNDPLWDAARNIPSPPPPAPARPQLEVDLSSLPPPRRRVRKAHLERCITLQHGMLRERESRALDYEPDDVLGRLSLYDDALSPQDLEPVPLPLPVREEDEYAAGPSTAPSVMQPQDEYFPTMAEILAAQEAEDAAQASLDASRTPDRSPMPPPSPSGTLFAVDRDSAHLDVGIHLGISYAEPPSAMSFPHTPAYTDTESGFPLNDPLDGDVAMHTPAYTRSIFPLGNRQSMYPETEAPRSPSDSIFPGRERDADSIFPGRERDADSVFPADRERHRSLYPETEAPRSPSSLFFHGEGQEEEARLYLETEAPRPPQRPGSISFPPESYPSLLHPDGHSAYADVSTPAYSEMVFGGLQTPSASTIAHLSHATMSMTPLDAFVFPLPPNNASTATLTPAPDARSHDHSPKMQSSSSSPHAHSHSPASRSPASNSPPSNSPPSRSPASRSPASRSPQPQHLQHPQPEHEEEEDADTDPEMDILSPRRSAHFQSEPRHSVLTLGFGFNEEQRLRLSAVYDDRMPLLTATTAHFRGVDSRRFSADGGQRFSIGADGGRGVGGDGEGRRMSGELEVEVDGRRFSEFSLAATSRGVPSISPTVAYEQVMTLLHPPSSSSASAASPRPEISKPMPMQEFPRSTPPEKTHFPHLQRTRNDSMPFVGARQRSDSVDQRQRVDSDDRRPRNDSMRQDSLDVRNREDSLDRRQRSDSLAPPLSPPAPTPPPKTNSVLRLAQRVQAQRELEEEEGALHLPPPVHTQEPGPPPIPLPAAPAAAGLPAHPAQHVRGLSNASAGSTLAPLRLQFPLPPPAPHQRKGSLPPASASAAPSAFKFASPVERPGMLRSQSDQALRQKALIGALRAESGYFDSDEEDAQDGMREQEDALEALKREMMQWRDGVARESEKRAFAEQEAARRKPQDEKRAPVMIEEPAAQAKTPPRSRVRKKRVPVVEMCDRCGFERDSGECVLAHAAPVPGPGLVRRSSSRSVRHERKDSEASSVGYARGLPRRATLHDRKDSASSAVGAPIPPRHTHDRRDSLARLNSALFASTAPAAAAAGPKTAPVTSHERTMSMMSGMSNASSFFSSDVNEIVLPGGRSFVSALEKLHTVSTTAAPAPLLKPTRSTERLLLPPPVTTTHTAASHKRGQSTEKFPSIRQIPSTERFAPPPPVASAAAAIRTMPSTERFASAERFAAFRERYGAGSDSTHHTFVTATQTGTSDLSHVPSSTEPSTVVAYASVSASASAESSWSSFPPTPADADWEYAFSATKTAAQKNVLRSQRSQEAIRRGAAAGPALGNATISSARGRAFVQQTSVYVPDEDVLSPEPAPKSASRWSEDSTRHAPPRDKAPSKQASRTNLNSPSVTRLARAPSVHSPGAGSESPSTPASSGGGGFAGLAKRLRLKSLPSKSKSPGGSGSSNSSGGGFGFARLGGLGVKNKSSTQEMRSGWMG